ncbi:MAG: M60 family metallopeptidase [Oscillospiraceae bacterium]|nr:M60 family metallopeptidase [Oscillospiraceae bacterium]
MKKQIIKKKIAFLLALSMLSNFSIAVGAKDALSGFGVSAVGTPVLTLEDENVNEITPESTEPATEEQPVENAGRVEVSLGMALFLDSASFQVRLTGNGYHEEQTVTFENQNQNQNQSADTEETASESPDAEITDNTNNDNKVVFKHLAPGSYTLIITANGFQTYEQHIEVNQKLYAIQLTAGFCADYDYERGLLHPGVLLIGDVNNNGKVDAEDRTALVNAIHTVKKHPEQVSNFKSCDLNGDGDVNIEDLMFFSKGYLETIGKHTTAHVTEMTSPDLIKIKTPEKVTVQGDVNAMMEGEGEVTFGLKEGEVLSEDNPIEVSFDVNSKEPMDAVIFGISEETPIEKAYIDVDYIDTEDGGKEKTIKVPFVSNATEVPTAKIIESGTTQPGDGDGNSNPEDGDPIPLPMEALSSEESEQAFEIVRQADEFLLNESSVSATLDKNGNIQVNLGTKVTVKKVTLQVTALAMADGQENNLVTIAKTEFVNDMASRIPEPDLNIPQITGVEVGSEEFTVSWKPETNVTGYEIQVKDGNKIVKTISTTATTVKVKEDKVIKNYVTYTVNVKSVNGTWSSPYSDSVTAMPLATKCPDKPDNVKVSGIHRGLNVSWSKMDDTQSYIIYYRLVGDENYTEISNITSNSCTINELEDVREYEVYVKGKNELGLSPESLHQTAKTMDLDLADMPKYKLINCDAEGNPGSTHITDVIRYGGEMIDSNRHTETGTSAWGAVDGVKRSYYHVNGANDGGWNWLGGNGLTYTFDDEYTLDTIGILTTTGIDFTHLVYWDKNGKEHAEFNGAWDYKNYSSRKIDAEGRPYYIIKLPYPITASKIQIGISRYDAPITIAETYFYHYDTLMDEVFALYIDDLHTVLREDVTQDTIDEMRVRINTPDEFGNINPNKDTILRELETAEKILNAESISSAVEIYTGITTNDVGRGFSGINAWQPLGVSIGTGEEVTIYVGSSKKKTGETSDLRLITTQYHSESSGVTLDGANLKVGANTFKLSQGKLAGVESGGALYVQYQGNSNTDERYSVRVTGGSEIPRLDLYQVTDATERLARTAVFIQKLDEYVPNIEALHNATHKGSGNKKIDYDYDQQNCILGASDILLDTMMISLPAKQMLAGTGAGTVEERAATLLQSMDAMEDMMYLFYQHKGLNRTATDQVDQIPKGHLNIRYQRMFSGAFMYASGNHIGIEWGSVSGIANSPGVKFDENGQYISGDYFGWGIAHEIGHNINQGAYTVTEITNNYFAQLAQAHDTNTGMRFQYDNIYEKVTSGTKGNCSNIATQLGMYWQLHLAYDKGLNYKTYADYNQQLNNLFYARVDTYARNTGKAPQAKTNGVALVLDGDTDQQLMRLACAAAQKDVLEFFRRWGKEPDIKTVTYAAQFEKENRAIMYANDDSRIYALNGEGSKLADDGSTKAITDISIKIGSQPNKVDLTITPNTTVPEKDVLLYEIIRCTISGGKVEEIPVGYTKSTEFTDTISTMNNRTVFYRVRMVDQYLNYSEVFETDPVKIEHDGSIDKRNWSISTTGLQAEAVVDDATDEMPCEKTTHNPAEQAIDTNTNTVYAPKVTSDNAEIIINFNQTLTVSGFKYTPVDAESSMKGYKIFVQDSHTREWVLTANGTFKGDKTETVYFANGDKEYVSTYSATAVKVVLLNQTNKDIAIAELDVLAPTGDNVDFRRTDAGGAVIIGILGEDYKYAETEPAETEVEETTTSADTDSSKAEETTTSADADSSKAEETTTSADTDSSKAEETTTSAESVTTEKTEAEPTKHPYTIPKGSLVFTGSYKGNPAYNVVILYDENGKIVGGVDEQGSIMSAQIILADVPEEGDITNVSDGVWVYWIEPEYLKKMDLPEKVRVELYRVNDALTNEGQRLVSDSLFEKLGVEDLSEFPTITFTGGEPVSKDNDADRTGSDDDKAKDKAKNDTTDATDNTTSSDDKDKDKNKNTEENSPEDTES